MGQVSRRAPKPECISAAAARAMARALASFGQSSASGKRSARYSEMARESQIVRSPSRRTGTRFDGDTAAMAAEAPSQRRATRSSSKAAPDLTITTQGRRDQEDQALVPMISCIRLLSPYARAGAAQISPDPPRPATGASFRLIRRGVWRAPPS